MAGPSVIVLILVGYWVWFGFSLRAARLEPGGIGRLLLLGLMLNGLSLAALEIMSEPAQEWTFRGLEVRVLTACVATMPFAGIAFCVGAAIANGASAIPQAPKPRIDSGQLEADLHNLDS